MSSTTSRFDGLIFDMDGTLWDAVDSYCAIWNRSIADLHLDAPPVCRDDLSRLMGVPLDGIYQRLIGSACEADRFMPVLEANSAAMMPVLGGKLYPQTFDTLKRLSQSARLFMVTNCEESTLPAFLDTTGLRPLMTDALCYGDTLCEKDVNIRRLVDTYGLKTPMYIGDTVGDCASSHRAGVPFAWASYGFGSDVPDRDFTLNYISDLIELCQK